MKTIHDYMIDVIKSNPGETQRGWELLAWKAFQSSPDMARTFFNYGVTAFWKGYQIASPGPNEIAVMPRVRNSNVREVITTVKTATGEVSQLVRRRKGRARTRAEAKARSEKKRTVIGLSMFQWYLRQTCGALKKFGGVGSEFAKCGKPNEILGNVITAEQAKAIFKRHEIDVSFSVAEAAAA